MKPSEKTATTPITTPNFSGLSHLISQKITRDTPVCIVVTNNSQVNRLAAELTGMLPQDANRIKKYPDIETLPYDMTQPHPALLSERMETLYALTQEKDPIVVASIPAWTTRIPCPAFYQHNCLLLQVGDELKIEDFRANMQKRNYQFVREVHEVHEFTIKGSIIDLFPTGSKNAYRIELFDNEVDSIRYLDVETQRSQKTLSSIRILPAQQYQPEQLTQGEVESKISQHLGNPQHSLLDKVRQRQHFAGMDYFLPLVHNSLSTLQQHLPAETYLIVPEDWEEQLNKLKILTEGRYQAGLAQAKPYLPPATVFDFDNKTGRNTQTYQLASNHSTSHALQSLPTCNHTLPAERLATFLQEAAKRDYDIHIISHDKDRSKNLVKFLHEHHLTYRNQPIDVHTRALQEGFIDHSTQVVWISEADILGRNIHWEQEKKPKHTESLDDWTIGAYLVHRDYGIGKLMAFDTLQHNSHPQDYLVLHYQDDDKLFVNTQKIHLLSLYRGKEIGQVQLDKLGGKKWQQKKQQASQLAKDFAAKLITHHTKRKNTQAMPCNPPGEEYLTFQESFPFETTVDQQAAIDAVLADLQKKHGMDRLVCGDVGFGKTEVALRAAFMCMMSGMQVAMLCPTTLLAEQHSRTCKERFAQWPFKVDNLSRLNKADQKDTLARLADGTTDCVVATHALLSPAIQFKRLGLIIIDEEHKFGVKQKEILHMLRGHAHILSMSATPIPRTLNLALAKVRDLSIIASPPKNRLKVHLEVGTYEENVIQEAIERERLRGGQVYYMHNDIKALPGIEEKIQKLCPQIKTAILSGRSHKSHLEKTMLAFSNQQFDVLIATSIIESGIDIPNANTILIHRADLLGLSQIHQLKGRVGRSQHQAYAYLFIPPENCLTREGKARIASIKKQNQLGAGFNIAMEDLEIRGAGDILGKKQSGHIAEVGMALYTQLLRKALSGSDTAAGDEQEIDIDSKIDTNIPATYINNIENKLAMYRKINEAGNQSALDKVRKEMEDRFGMLPIGVRHCLSEQKLKNTARKIGIEKIHLKKNHASITVCQQNTLDLRKLATHYGHTWSLRIQSPTQIHITKKNGEEITSYEEIEDILTF